MSAAAGDSILLDNGWTFTDLGEATPTLASVAESINASGRVVGYLATPTETGLEYRAAEFTGASVKLLGTSDQTVAWDINDGGTIVGQSGIGGASGSALELTEGDEDDLGSGSAFAINASGAIVGVSTFATGATIQAASFGGSSPVDIDDEEGSLVSVAYDVNAPGTIVGIQLFGTAYRGVTFGPNTAVIDAAHPDFLPVAINDADQSVGVLANGHAAINSGGVTTDLGAGPAGGGWVFNDLNDAGEAVGIAHGTVDGTVSDEAGVYAKAGVIHVIDDWLPEELGWQFLEPKSINETGSMVGAAVKCTDNDSGCTAHAFRLDPPGVGTTTSTTGATTSTTGATTSSTGATTSSTAPTTSTTGATTSSTSTTTSSTSSTSTSTSSTSSTSTTTSSTSSTSTTAPTTSSTSSTSTTAPTTSSTAATTSTTAKPGSGAAAISLGQSSAAAGSSVSISGTGFGPGTTVNVELHSTPVSVGTFVARVDGTFSGTFTVPADTAIGSHEVVAVGTQLTGTTVTARAPLTVVKALAKTGTDVRQWTLLGLLALGVGLVVFGRSRILSAR